MASTFTSTMRSTRLSVGPGGERFEVFVTRYYDRTKGDGSERLHDDAITGPHKARGRTLDEAFQKSAESARRWAREQR